MTSPSHFTHTASYAIMNRWHAARIVLITMVLYGIAAVLIEATAPRAYQMLGLALLALVTQFAVRSPFQHLHLSLRSVDEDGSDATLTPEHWARVVQQIEMVTIRTLRTTPSPYTMSVVDLDVSPDMANALLTEGSAVEIPMQMGMREDLNIDDDEDTTDSLE